MKTWFKRIAAVLVALILLVVSGIYVASELRRTKTYDAPLTAFDATRFHFAPGEAERRTRSMMCLGCHGEAGRVIFEEKQVGRLVAPNLTKLIPLYTDSELERLIRRGIRKDGTAAVAMPAATYAFLADEDLAAIITYMRSRAPVPEGEPKESEWGPLGRVALALGKIPYEADRVTQSTHPKTRPSDTGAYLVGAICAHCHNLDSDHDNGFGMKTPALRVVMQSYAFDDFARMMRTGKGKGDRDLGLMSEEARGSFSHFSDAELKAVYDYLARTEN